MKRIGVVGCTALLVVVFWAGPGWAQTDVLAPAAFRFVNRSGADIQVRAAGGFEREFLVDDGDSVVQTVPPGSATEIAYWPPWGDGYLETEANPRHLALRAPDAGMTNDVALTLARRTSVASAAPADSTTASMDLKLPMRENPPSLRVRNVTPLRGMVVTVTRISDGSAVEEFTLEKGGERLVELPEAGRYRIQTRARPDKRNDAEQNPASYEATDETVECDWGNPVVLDCTVNLKREPGQGVPTPDQGDWVQDAVVSALNAAKVRVEEEWGEHSAQATIWAIDRALQKAANFARNVNVDGFAGDAVPYREWAAGVAAKRGVRNADWQRIVAATEASETWTEFFSRSPEWNRRY